MKYLLTITILFFFVLARGQSPTVPQIIYTPMTAGGYQFKYLKADSGLNIPNRDTSYGRGTRRGGSIVFDTTTRIFYGWDGIRWQPFGTGGGSGTFFGIDSVTYNNNFICQWKNGTSTCYPVIPGVDSVVVTNDSLCQWKAGVSTCYAINGNVLGVFVDSVVVAGTQLCQWISGVSTCYTINAVNTSIDSITIINNNFCIYIGGVASCITLQPDTVYVRAPDLGVYWDSTGHQVIFETQDDGLIWGGIVTGGTNCMDIDITPAYYYHDGNAFLSAQTTLTISASDPTLNRYDLIVVDTFGLVTVIAGTAATNPVIPQHNPGSQIPLTSIYVPAGATCLPISKGMIYNENIEYTTSSTGTVTVDYNNTANPHALTKAAYVSAYDYGSTLTFTKPSGQDTIRAGAILKFWIYLNKAFTGSLQVQFFNGAIPVSSRQAVAGSDGFLPLDTTQYRNISMVLGNWAVPPTIWNKLVIYPSGQDLSGAGGFYLDEIQVQTGLTPQGKAYVDSVYRIGDSLYYTKSGVQVFITGLSTGIAQFNPIAGTNITLTGTYPNITFNAAGSAQVTDKLSVTATAGQTVVPFSGIPASANDADIFVNSCYIKPSFYTISAGVGITFTTGLTVGDVVDYARKK